MSERQEHQHLVSHLQLLCLYVKALEQEDLQTANKICGIIYSDGRLKNAITEINIAYEKENLTSPVLKDAEFLTGKIRLVIIEGNYIIRTGIRTTLSENPEIEVIGEASSYFDGLTLIQQQQPDVAIIDADLPDKNGIELTRQLQQSNLDVKSVILAKYNNTETVVSAFTAGANSYCLKDIKYHHLLEAIRVTRSGKKWLDPVVGDIILDIAQTCPLSAVTPFDIEANIKFVEEAIQCCGFTQREVEVLGCVVAGSKNAEIAKKLYITVGTVKAHITNLYSKLGASNRIQALIQAIRFGIIELK